MLAEPAMANANSTQAETMVKVRRRSSELSKPPIEKCKSTKILKLNDFGRVPLQVPCRPERQVPAAGNAWAANTGYNLGMYART